MKKLLYHGSKKIIRNPLFGFGRTDNDYGRGFYTTGDIELAKEWACQKETDGYVNTYTFDSSELKFLVLNSKKFSILHWLAILIENREVDDIDNQEAIDFLKENYSINTNKYDVIIGYRADDSFFTFARDFINDAITLQALYSAMTFGKLGLQIMLKSEKAFNSIKFKEVTPVSMSIYYKKYKERENIARAEYKRLKGDKKSQGIIMTEIIKNPQLLIDYEESLRSGKNGSGGTGESLGWIKTQSSHNSKVDDDGISGY